MDELFAVGNYLVVMNCFDEDGSLGMRMSFIVPMKSIAILAKEKLAEVLGSEMETGESPTDGKFGKSFTIDIHEVKDSLLVVDNLTYIDFD